MGDQPTEAKAAEIASALIDAAHEAASNLECLLDEREEVEDFGDAAACVAFIESSIRAATEAMQFADACGEVWRITVQGDHVNTGDPVNLSPITTGENS